VLMEEEVSVIIKPEAMGEIIVVSMLLKVESNVLGVMTNDRLKSPLIRDFGSSEQQKAKQAQLDLILEAKAQEIYDKINGLSLNFSLKKNEKGEPLGSVGFKEILSELEKSGFQLEKKQLPDFRPLHKLGENMIK
ncbi:8057_t:CDS:2, partial [Ambispora leptoticha]